MDKLVKGYPHLKSYMADEGISVKQVAAVLGYMPEHVMQILDGKQGADFYRRDLLLLSVKYNITGTAFNRIFFSIEVAE